VDDGVTGAVAGLLKMKYAAKALATKMTAIRAITLTV
jgi:hypothetical protein